MASHNVGEVVQDEDAAELTFPKEFENAETLLISEVRSSLNFESNFVLMLLSILK